MSDKQKKITNFFKGVTPKVHSLQNNLNFELFREREIEEENRRHEEEEARKRRYLIERNELRQRVRSSVTETLDNQSEPESEWQ
jgi:hypothetical protein